MAVPGRPVSVEPTVARVGVGLVERRPPVHVRRERTTHAPHVAFEGQGSRFVAPGMRALAQPRREREVPEHDHAAHPSRTDAAYDVHVVGERIGVEPSPLGLDARPFDRDPVGVQAELDREIEVLGPPVPGIARRAGWLRHPPRLLERPPVGAVAPALGLVAGRRRAPEEAVREGGLAHGCAYFTNLIMLKWPSAFLRHSRWVMARTPPAICTLPQCSHTTRWQTEHSPSRRVFVEPQCGHICCDELGSGTVVLTPRGTQPRHQPNPAPRREGRTARVT